jgi:hypothetical protein
MKEVHAMKQSALLVAGTLCLAAANLAAAQTKTPAKAPEFLFVQTAKNIAYKDGVLTLQDVSPVTVFFSDRPKRIVGNVRNDVFFQKWTEGSNSFKRDPPNAVLMCAPSRVICRQAGSRVHCLSTAAADLAIRATT